MRGSGEEVGFLWPYPILQPLLCPPCRKSYSKGVLIKSNRCFFGTAWRLLLIKESNLKHQHLACYLAFTPLEWIDDAQLVHANLFADLLN